MSEVGFNVVDYALEKAIDIDWRRNTYLEVQGLSTQAHFHLKKQRVGTPFLETEMTGDSNRFELEGLKEVDNFVCH